MKKLAILTLIIAFSSCSMLKPTTRTVESYFADYRPYAEEGFLISPNPYTDAFESIGEIEIVITPALKQQSNAYGAKYMKYEDISGDELLRIAVNDAKDKGADAIVNFSITRSTISSSDAMGVIRGEEYRIKGFCIKRK